MSSFNPQEPKILDVKERILIGMRIMTSLSQDATKELWQSFMSRRKEIENAFPGAYYSVQVYDVDLNMADFSPETKFEKWAAIEVVHDEKAPEGMDAMTLPGGKYAVFIHKGMANAFPETAQFIFQTWLANSEYELDDRPHFEIMREKYFGPNDPDSEEEVWIPIK
jgi:AraC family transcriptional regulator